MKNEAVTEILSYEDRNGIHRIIYPSVLGTIEISIGERHLLQLRFQSEAEPFPSYDNMIAFSPTDKSTEWKKAATGTIRWLDTYFSGENPPFLPPFHLCGTSFQKVVWNLLLLIPYGTTTSYGAIARETARILGKEHMSAQAIGSAVGHNPIAIIIPCHRVIGATGKLTGYAYGLERKEALLSMEKASLYPYNTSGSTRKNVFTR